MIPLAFEVPSTQFEGCAQFDALVSFETFALFWILSLKVGNNSPKGEKTFKKKEGLQEVTIIWTNNSPNGVQIALEFTFTFTLSPCLQLQVLIRSSIILCTISLGGRMQPTCGFTS